MGWVKSRFTLFPLENNTIVNNIRINSVFHILTTVNLLLAHPVLKAEIKTTTV